MIHFTSPGGAPVSVNPAEVFSIKPVELGTAIFSSNGTQVTVKEPFDEVERRVKEWEDTREEGGEHGDHDSVA